MRARWLTTLQLLLVTLLGLPFITPLLRWSSVPCTHDGHLHYHRVAAIRHAWENGVFFSRWLPDLVFGYGYPFFNYREPLPLYLTHFLHLTGLPLPAATNLFYILCFLASGWFTFLWVRDVFGVRAAFISAVAYMAAPYLFADALVRGNQVESTALALMPFLLWTGRRYLLSGKTSWFLAAVGGLAALALSHNISLLLFTPALLLYLLVLAWLHHLPWKPALWRVGFLLVLGLGLTAFYTGPALLEMDAVTLSLSTTTRNNDFRFNFATLTEIFAPVAQEDPALLNPPLLFRLGWVPAGLGFLGLLSALVNKQREQRAHIVLMGLAAAVFLFFALAAARPVWAALPLIDFVQFPWRFVGRAALPLALLAGAPFSTQLAMRRPSNFVAIGQRLLFYIALLLLFLEAVPLLYPAICEEDPYPNIQTVHTYERETGLVGVDPEGSYFPRTVETRPTGSPLEADYAASRMPFRFEQSTLPAGGTVELIAATPLSSEFRVETPEPFHATYLAYAFPGWRVEIDGRPVAITPNAPEGLITFPVPAGEHTITVRWGSTPLRTTLSLVSLAALVGVVVVAAGRFSIPAATERRTMAQPAGSSADFSATEYGALCLLALLLLGAKVLLFDRVETPWRRVAEPQVAEASGITAGLTGRELQLAGYNLSRDAVPAGETFDIDLAWETLANPAGAYQSNVWLEGPEGLVWSAKETYRPRIYEDAPNTLFWQPGQWAWDSREVQVLPGTPPGRYDLVLTLFPLDTLQPLPLIGPDGVNRGPAAVIGQIDVTRPDSPPELNPQFPLDINIQGLRFLGYNQDRAEAAPGDPLLLTLFWEKERTDARPAKQLALTLRDGGGEVVQSWSISPVSAGYHPEQWAAGERLRGQQALRLPAWLASGAYQFYLEEVPLGQLAVQAPERAFIAPAFTTLAGVPFGEQVNLAGYTLDCPLEPGGRCAVQLVWEGLAEIATSYHIFVHLVDEAGNILAQADGQPAGWTRPTTGWAPGEYIVDDHQLVLPGELPAGTLQLRVGVYEPETGVRLRGPAGEEYIIITP